jgi:hypothetical protein
LLSNEEVLIVVLTHSSVLMSGVLINSGKGIVCTVVNKICMPSNNTLLPDASANKLAKAVLTSATSKILLTEMSALLSNKSTHPRHAKIAQNVFAKDTDVV